MPKVNTHLNTVLQAVELSPLVSLVLEAVRQNAPLFVRAYQGAM